MARTILLLVSLLLIGLFAALNWPVFTAPTTLSLGVREVDAPLGLIMLGLLVAVALVFTAWALTLQGSLLAASRRQARELQAQRELADKAEASRFTELRQHLHDEMARLTRETRAALQATESSLAAQIGELDDRLVRQGAAAGEVVRSSLMG